MSFKGLILNINLSFWIVRIMINGVFIIFDQSQLI